ncbi:hypothetical protein [Gallaecimonas sp. GXIMD4217]|uniref:hypothetical protein n=1 Tax=Gallaecimonas sp. GXIMD4217 TaxID=3131927 RepID=UPI00311ACB79
MESKSCTACIKKNELKGNEHIGLLCGACGGIGMAEPVTERLNKRAKPLLAMGVVFAMLVIVFVLAFSQNPHFTEVLAFASMLVGSVVTYYFSAGRDAKTG